LITLRADAGGNFHGGAIAEPALFGPKLSLRACTL
jgi:hypothetical protein